MDTMRGTAITTLVREQVQFRHYNGPIRAKRFFSSFKCPQGLWDPQIFLFSGYLGYSQG